MLSKLLNIIVCCVIVSVANGQSASDDLWHGKERVLEYRLALPEFALYLPGMGGNFKLGLKMGNETKWLTSSKLST